MITDSIEEHLINLERRLDALPEAEAPPPTTLQVLGRSRRERFWQQLLVHFLSPKEAHGLGTAILEHFLNGLSTHSNLDFSYSRLDLDNIQIQQEVSTDQGRPDLVIWSQESWFLCIEMKVGATEGDDQTQRYVNVDFFDEIDLGKNEIPEENHYYVYLAPENASSPGAEEFVSVSWEWLASELQTFLASSYGEHPTRTNAQLNDFIDTIRSELTMTDYQENQQEKVALGIEHYEPMIEVLDALENYVNNLQDSWPDWFLEQNPEGWNTSWNAVEGNNTYMNVYHDEWIIYPSDGETNTDPDIYIYWEFRVSERHIGRGIVNHSLVVTGENDALIETFRNHFYDETIQQSLSRILTDLRANSNKEVSAQDWSDNTYERVIDGDYQFEFNGGEGFKQTAVTAFEDLQPVFELVTEAVPER